MKKSLPFIFAFLIVLGCAFGKIKNGYLTHLEDCKKSLRALQNILTDNDNLSAAQRRKVNAKINDLTNFIWYHELTEQLISQLLMISPDLYYQMDNLRDKRGRLTDIYIKLIPKEEAIIPLTGATFLLLSEDDEDAHSSEYGQNSVSVKIWIGVNALQLLYHELGHTNYIVPNIATYASFYKQHYRCPHIASGDIGHHPMDEGGKMAQAYETRYRQDYASYLKSGGTPLDSMLSLMQKMRKGYLTKLARLES